MGGRLDGMGAFVRPFGWLMTMLKQRIEDFLEVINQ